MPFKALSIGIKIKIRLSQLRKVTSSLDRAFFSSELFLSQNPTEDLA